MKGRLSARTGAIEAPQVPGRCGWFSVSSMTVMMAYSCISRWSGALGVCAIVAIVRPAMPIRARWWSCSRRKDVRRARPPTRSSVSSPGSFGDRVEHADDYWTILAGRIRWRMPRFSARQKPIPICVAIATSTRRKSSSTGRAFDRQRSRRHRRCHRNTKKTDGVMWCRFR